MPNRDELSLPFYGRLLLLCLVGLVCRKYYQRYYSRYYQQYYRQEREIAQQQLREQRALIQDLSVEKEFRELTEVLYEGTITVVVFFVLGAVGKRLLAMQRIKRLQRKVNRWRLRFINRWRKKGAKIN